MYHPPTPDRDADAAPDPEGGPPSGRGRLLVIEDHDESRFLLRTALERAGWEVDETSSGEEGLRLARRLHPRVVIVDISLPGLDGWEITRRLKAEHGEGGPRVLAVTAHGLDDDRESSREAGCDGYMVKPIDLRELLAEVDRLASPSAAGPAGRGAP